MTKTANEECCCTVASTTNSNSCTRKTFTDFLVDFNNCKTHKQQWWLDKQRSNKTLTVKLSDRQDSDNVISSKTHRDCSSVQHSTSYSIWCHFYQYIILQSAHVESNWQNSNLTIRHKNTKGSRFAREGTVGSHADYTHGPNNSVSYTHLTLPTKRIV